MHCQMGVRSGTASYMMRTELSHLVVAMAYHNAQVFAESGVCPDFFCLYNIHELLHVHKSAHVPLRNYVTVNVNTCKKMQIGVSIPSARGGQRSQHTTGEIATMVPLARYVFRSVWHTR